MKEPLHAAFEQEGKHDDKNVASCSVLLSTRLEIGTTIVTYQSHTLAMGEIFDSVTASAIPDRLFMNSTFLAFEGRSYRNRRGGERP